MYIAILNEFVNVFMHSFPKEVSFYSGVDFMYVGMSSYVIGVK